MLEEEAAEEEVSVVVAVEGVLSDCELANAFALMQVSAGLDFEHGLVDLEKDWANVFGKVFALHFRVTESWI